MFFIAGMGSRVKQTGYGSCSCPACGRHVSMHTIKKYQVVTFFFIPVIPFGGEYIATCPACASIMALRKEKGRALEKGQDQTINSNELELLKNNAGSSCIHCGARVASGQNFCPNCGERL